MKAVFEDMTAVDQFWKRCTDENMSEVRILNGEGLTVGAYKDMCLMSPAFTLDKTEVEDSGAYNFTAVKDGNNLKIATAGSTFSGKKWVTMIIFGTA